MSGRACSLAWPDFFERQTMAAEEAVHRRGGEAFAMLPLQPFRDLGQSDVGHSDVGQSDVGQSDVGRGLHQSRDRRAAGLDPARPRVAGLRQRRNRPGLEPPPLHRRGRGYPETGRRRTAAHARINRRDHTFSEVKGQRFGHAGWPPSPASMVNHKPDPLRIPRDSITSKNTLGVQSRHLVEIVSHDVV